MSWHSNYKRRSVPAMVSALERVLVQALETALVSVPVKVQAMARELAMVQVSARASVLESAKAQEMAY
jgi:hypothetical protein